MKQINARIFNPNNALFKQSANEKASLRVISCEIPDKCPLYKQGSCIQNSIFENRCIYGERIGETGFSKRARKFSSWIWDRQRKYKDILDTCSGLPAKKLAFIGDYVYLPYFFMDKVEGVELKFGKFIKKEDFNLENVLKLVDFRPQALFGGEIRSYQGEEVPLFIQHLSETEETKEIYKKLIGSRPGLNKNISKVGREALLKTINPSTIETKNNKWIWNGKKLIAEHYREWFADFKTIEEIKVEIIPSDKTTVKITNDQQVSNKTIFID